MTVGGGSQPGGSAAERVRLWAVELFRELLPEQAEPGTPVLLACDDETIRVISERLGFDSADPSVQFGHDVCVAFGVAKMAGWRTVVAGDWATARVPRPLPLFFPALCLWVLAASRMTHDERHHTGEYHGRLCHLLGVSGDDSLPSFNLIGPRFRDLAGWLKDDLEGRHGYLLVPENPHPEHVGLAVTQTVFRLRDRQVLSSFFAERLAGSLEGFDPLRRLQRWSGRSQLTGHAQRLLEDETFADRVRAAIRVAFRSWDGAELVEVPGGGVGRYWPASVRLLIYPQPHLQLGAGHSKPVELQLDNETVTLSPGRELELPWSLVDRAVEHQVDFGDPRSASGGIRLPRTGPTLIFENSEEGMFRVERPADETVWVLTCDESVQRRLAPRRFNDRDLLPNGWQLFYEVPVGDVPGVERATVGEPQRTPLRIEGGLPLGRPLYLSAHSPHLVAGDLETDEHLEVRVNGTRHGLIASNGRLPLPGEPGRYEVDVGNGEFRTSYDVEECGEPAELQLFHELDTERALRLGARPARRDENHVRVCGAIVEPPYSAVVPILTRVLCNVETICSDGRLVMHVRPPTPAWFKEVGLSERSRWELFGDHPVIWMLMPPAGGKPRVRLLSDIPLDVLSGDAAERVLALGEDVDVVRGTVDVGESQARWVATLELARATTANEVPA